jgi:hypothetical protein
MNKHIAALALAAVTTFNSAHAGNTPDGVVDFGKFSPTPGAEFVEVNVNSNLIAMVVNFAKKQEPQIAEVLGGLKSVRVNVLGVNDKNREEITKRMNAVRTQLDGSGWERLVTVMKDKNDVGIFMKTRGAEVVEGVVVTVLNDENQAVFVNVVGDIRPEKLATVGERFNIEPLKHLPAPAEKSAK